MSRISVTGFLSVKQTVSPERFLEIAKNNQRAIKHVQFVPPKLGTRNDFGKVEIEYFPHGRR